MFQFPSVKIKRWIKNHTLSATHSITNLKILRYYLLFFMHINKRHLLNSILPTELVEGLSSNGILALNETWNQKLVKGSISYRSGRCNMPLTSDSTEFESRFQHVTPAYSECHTSLLIKECEVKNICFAALENYRRKLLRALCVNKTNLSCSHNRKISVLLRFWNMLFQE